MRQTACLVINPTSVDSYASLFNCTTAMVVSGPIWPKFELVRDFMHIRTTEKRWRHHFPNYTSVGPFCCHGNQSFDPICPKTLCSLSPAPMMLQIKFDQDWPTGFRDIPVQKCEIFVTRASNSKISGLNRPKIELNRAVMPVLVTSNFDDDSIKNERANLETPFPIISLWEIF